MGFTATVLSQNVGIGTTAPVNKLQVMGNILVNAPTTSTASAPTIAQTQTMTNGGTINFAVADSVGRIYDPGGPAGNYINSLSALAVIPQSGAGPGYEITLEDVELLSGDSLIIIDAYNASIIYLAVGNGNSTLVKMVINAYSLRINFKSNADGINGRGFNLLFRRLYDNTASAQSLGGAIGNSFFFDTKKGALRSGRLASAAIGYYSSALGFAPEAIGDYSFASGYQSRASGQLSTAMGGFSTASGDRSFAIGSGNTAVGEASVAMGGNTSASGPSAFAMGVNAIASGQTATALGETTTASGQASTSMGENTLAIGRNSVAMGEASSAGGKNAIAMGHENTANGENALATGQYTRAIGISSTALGERSEANGIYSTALGFNSRANGPYSTALGQSTISGGYASTAIGRFTTASGDQSTAMGYNTTASGHNSTALGTYVSTSSFNGAFVIGDNSTTTVMGSFVNNGFRSRFAGGYRLLTNSAASLGVVLLPDGGSWSAISDVRLKENFLPVNAENILKKITTLPLTTWNYIEQSSKTSRHYGPMAQDFYKAFGHDAVGEIGCDTLINQQDFLGVNLIAIQALEKRTALLQEQLNKAIELIKVTQQTLVRLEEENLRLKKSSVNNIK